MSSVDFQMNTEEFLVCDRLRKMKMSFMAEAYEQQLENPNADLAPFSQRFSDIVEREWQARYDRKLARFIKDAHIRYPSADFDETLQDPERMLDVATIESLANCEWITQGKSLIITGATSSGKSYLASCFCVAAVSQFLRVRYIKASILMSEMARAEDEGTQLDYLNKLAKLDLLVIDDFGLMYLDLDKCRYLFEVIDSREGRRSTMVISQFPVESWFDMFADSTYADACLSRLTDKRNTYRLQMNGKSMREGA